MNVKRKSGRAGREWRGHHRSQQYSLQFQELLKSGVGTLCDRLRCTAIVESPGGFNLPCDEKGEGALNVSRRARTMRKEGTRGTSRVLTYSMTTLAREPRLRSRIESVWPAGCSERPPSKAAASEEAKSYSLPYVEPLSAATCLREALRRRQGTPLADFVNSLLGVRERRRHEGESLTVFIEMPDINYPGSTDRLAFSPGQDRLTGSQCRAQEHQPFNGRFAWES